MQLLIGLLVLLVGILIGMYWVEAKEIITANHGHKLRQLLIKEDHLTYDEADKLVNSMTNDQIKQACQTFKKYPSKALKDGAGK